MKLEDIRRILVVGSGTMGQRIALQCARYGYEVIAYDRSAESLEIAKVKIPAYAAEFVAQQGMTPEESAAALARITYTLNPEDGATADLVSESVYEDPELKARVFAQFNSICPPHTIFTTNTSTLLPSMYAMATGRPPQFAALHFYWVWDGNMADVMPHPGTSPETVELLAAFAKGIGQIPLVFKKEVPGYVGNALLGALNNAAIKLAITDEAVSIEDVDRTAMLVLGMPKGPFGILDVVSLDTLWRITVTTAKLSGDPGALEFAENFIKKRYLDKGLFGVKSGGGFYTYPNPAYSRPDFLTADFIRDADVSPSD
jgi:3-hydroxybutyryl-CoA dehydrogenase